jgi:hypothetical protein
MHMTDGYLSQQLAGLKDLGFDSDPMASVLELATALELKLEIFDYLSTILHS